MRISTNVGIPGLDMAAGGNPAFRQDGPTLDLVFVGTATDELLDGPTLDLNFVQGGYQVAAQYAVGE